MANSDKNIRIVTSKNKATYPNIVFTGSAAGSSVITLNVLDDNTLSFESNEGQVFSLNSNLSSGTIFSVTDISGIHLIRASAGATIGIAEYSGLVGIGTDIPIHKLHVRGQVAFASTNDQSLTFIFDNSLPSGNANLQIRSANEIRFYNSANSFYTGLKSGSSIATTVFTLPISDGSAGQILRTNGFAGLSFTSFSPVSSLSSVVSTQAQNTNHLILFTPSQNISGSAVSSNPVLVYNPFTQLLSVSGLAVTSKTDSSSKSSGALIVSGGVGIGGSISLGNRLSLYNDSNYITFLNSSTASTIYTLPINSPQAVGTSVLSSKLDGTMSWVPLISGGSGVVDSGIAGSVAFYAADGTTISGSRDIYISTGNGVTINPSTVSLSTTTGALVVNGGVGVGGTINIGQRLTVGSNLNSTSTTTGALVNSGGLGLAGNAFIGGTVIAPLFSGNFSGTAATITNIYGTSVSSPTITSSDKIDIQTSIGQTAAIQILAGNSGASGTFVAFDTLNKRVGLGISTPVYTLDVVGDINASSGQSFRIGGTVVLNRTTLGTGVTNSSLESLGTIRTGVWAATAITTHYGGTGLQTPLAIGDLLYADTTTTWARLSAVAGVQVLTSNGTNTAPQYIPQSLLSVGSATTSSNLRIVNTNSSSIHPVLFTPSINTSGSAVSANGTFVYNPSTDILSVSGLAITSSTFSSSSTTGALIVTGGVGVGQSVSIGGRLQIFNGTNAGFAAFSYTGSATTSYTLPNNSPQSSAGTSVLSSTIDGVMSWVPMTSGSSSNPGDGDTAIQFNDSGSFGGTTAFTFNKLSNLVSIASTADHRDNYNVGLRLVNDGPVSNQFGLVAARNSPGLELVGIGQTGSVTSGGNYNRFAFDVIGASNSIESSLRLRYSWDGRINGAVNFLNLVQYNSTKGLGIGASDSSYFNYFRTPNSQASDKIYILPNDFPSTGTSYLASDTSGNLSWSPVVSSTGSTVSSGVATRLAYYQNSGTAITDTFGINYRNSGTASTFIIFGGASSGNTIFSVHAESSTSLKVGIGVSLPTTTLDVSGDIKASNVNIRKGNSLLLYSSGDSNYTEIKSNSASNYTLTFPTSILSSPAIGSTYYIVSNSTGALSFAPIPKQTHRIQFATSYNPTVGGDSAVFMLPFSYSDGVSIVTWRMRRVDCRVETSSATGSTFSIEKYAYNNGSGIGTFSTTSTGSTENIMSEPLRIIGSGIAETYWTTFAGTHITAMSGDKLRLNFSNVSALHENFSISLIMEQDI